MADKFDPEKERDLEPKLQRNRAREWKLDFSERIKLLAIKDIAPKNVVEEKLKKLDEIEKKVLTKKYGDKEAEKILGVKHMPR